MEVNATVSLLAKLTTLPWRVERFRESVLIQTGYNRKKRTIARLGNSLDPVERYYAGCLMGAAPDLYIALKGIYEALDQDPNGEGRDYLETVLNYPAKPEITRRRLIEAALARAEARPRALVDVLTEETKRP